jgi:hypothetical protein
MPTFADGSSSYEIHQLFGEPSSALMVNVSESPGARNSDLTKHDELRQLSSSLNPNAALESHTVIRPLRGVSAARRHIGRGIGTGAR